LDKKLICENEESMVEKIIEDKKQNSILKDDYTFSIINKIINFF
jgi:hypothetical protein